MTEPYDSEDGKDAWKQYRRLIESIDPAVQSMLHTFGSEQYQYGYAAGLRDAVTAIQADFEFDELGDQRHAVDIIEALGGSA